MAKKFNFASEKELEDYLNSFKDANSKDIILGEKCDAQLRPER